MKSTYRPASRVLPDGRVVTGDSIPENTPVKKPFCAFRFLLRGGMPAKKKFPEPSSTLANRVANTVENRNRTPPEKETTS